MPFRVGSMAIGTSGDFGFTASMRDEVSPVLDNITNKVVATQSKIETSTGSTAGATAAMGGWGKSILGAGMLLTSLGGIAITTGKQIFEMGKEGASLERLRDSAADLAAHYGQNMDDMLVSLREYSQGAISDTNLILAADKAMMLGVTSDADQMGNLMQVAALRGRAMGVDTTQAFEDIVRGIGRMSPKILDNLGIVIDIDKAYKDYAISIGKAGEKLTDTERRQALLAKVLEEGNSMLEDAGGLAVDNATSYERMGASWDNLVAQIKMTAAPTGAAMADAATTAIAGWDQYFKFLENKSKIYDVQKMLAGYDKGYTGPVSTERVDAQYQNAIDLMSRMQMMVKNTSDTYDDYGDVVVETADAIVLAVGQVNEAFSSQLFEAKDLFGITMDLQKVDTDYKDTLAGIALQREEINAKLAAHKMNAKEAAEAEKKLADAEREAATAAMESSEKIVFGLISQKLAASDNYAQIMELGAAWGLITPSVATAGAAIVTVLDDTRLTADEQNIAWRRIIGTMLDTATTAEDTGPRTAKALDPIAGSAQDAAQKTGDLSNNIWNLKNQQGTFSYEFLIKVTGRLPTINTGGWCFVPWTSIQLADGSTTRIDCIEIGDQVLTMDPITHETKSARVTRVFSPPKGEVDGHLVLNDILGVTKEHPVYANGEWVKAGNLHIGDTLLTTTGDSIAVSKLQWIAGPTSVYTLETDSPYHDFFAEGFLVHNKNVKEYYATGGQMDGRNWAVVGERGFELVSPTGYVFDHDQSRALLESGLNPDRELGVGGFLTAQEEADYYAALAAQTGSSGKKPRRKKRISEEGGGTLAISATPVASATAVTAAESIAALATQTAGMASKVEASGTKQVAATQQSTAIMSEKNTQMVEQLEEIKNLLARLPTAQEQMQLAKAAAAQAV